MRNYFLWSIPLILLTACDSHRVYEKNTPIESNKWYYHNKPAYFVEVRDTSLPYHIYFNVRHTGDYKYSNLFILFSIQTPGDSIETERYEFRLANPDGEWLGSGLGDMYSNRIKILDSVKFPKPGIYLFNIEQNMRENPLPSIEDVGIRIEKAGK